MGVLTGVYEPFLDSDTTLHISERTSISSSEGFMVSFTPDKIFFSKLDSFWSAEQLIILFLLKLKEFITENIPLDNRIHKEVSVLEPYCVADAYTLEYGYSNLHTTIAIGTRSFKVGDTLL